MPTVAVEGFGNVKFPDTMSPDEIRSAIEKDILPQKSKATQQGKRYAQEETAGPALLNALNGLTFDFGDEIAGAVTGVSGLAAGRTYDEGYRSGRDYVRGAVEEHRKQYPVSATIGTIGGALAQAPALPVAALGKAGLAMRALAGAGYGAGFGAAQGAGASASTDTMMEEAAGGGIKGAALGGAFQVVGAGLGGAVNAVAARTPQGAKNAWNSAVSSLHPALQSIADRMGLRFDGAMAEQLALRQVGQAMAREGKTGATVRDELARLGPEARTADSVGLDVLDTMANLPGKTRPAAQAAIRSRQETRPDRLEAVAHDMAGTTTRGKDIITDLTTTQEVNAGPLYALVDEMSVPLTPTLMELTNRPAIKAAFAAAEKTVANRGERFAENFDRELATNGTMPLRFWDDVKKGLDDVISGIKRDPNNTQAGNIASAQLVKKELVRELDKLSTNPKTGRSVYADARDAFAGPAALKDMIEEGRRVFSMSEQEIEQALFKASKSEIEAFRLGAADAWRNKIGTRSGISSVLAAPFERNTQMMLKSVFGDKAGFERSMATINAEGAMRKLESVAGGSPTARRLANQEDAAGGVVEDVANAAMAASGGHISGIVRAGRSLAGRLGTPEVVRDEIGRVLLLQHADKLRGRSRDEILTMIDEVAKSIAMGNSQAAAISGVLGGSIPLR